MSKDRSTAFRDRSVTVTRHVWAHVRSPAGIDLVGLLIAIVFLIALIAGQLFAFGLDIRHWDLMAISGYSTVVVALWLVQGLEGRFLSAVERVQAGRTLQFPDEPARAPTAGFRKRFRKRVGDEAPAWRHVGGVAVGLLMLIAWPVASLSAEYPVLTIVVGTVPAIVVGFFVGRRVGLLIYYGWLGIALPTEARVVPRPGHPDGAAGLRPIGDFYLWQSFLLWLPAAHLLVWTLAIPFWDHNVYEHWRPWYQGLLALVIALQLVAFFGPMWRFHRVMGRARHTFGVQRAAGLARSIAVARRQLERELSADERSTLNARLSELEHAYEQIDQMPTWPINRLIRRRFTARSLALFIPLLLQWLDVSDEWGELAREFVETPPA